MMNDNKTEVEGLRLKRRFGLPLLIWGGINMIFGIFFLISFLDVVKGTLFQALLWGVIDGLLGLGILLFKKEFNLNKIKKILLINLYLDVGYVAVGILLMVLGGNGFLIGNGLGVVIQGGFLFILDLIHYRHIKINLME